MPSLPDTSPIVVASHPRSGTHLLIDLLRWQFNACRSWKWWGERLDRLYCSIDELGASRGRLDESTAQTILSRTDRPIVKTHAWPSLDEAFLQPHHDGLPNGWSSWLKQRGLLLYSVRDVRDVMASYQMFRDWFEDHPGDLGTFIRGSDALELPNRVANWTHHVRAWQEAPYCHVIRFEDLLQDTEAQIQRLSELLGLDPDWKTPLLPERFSSIWDSRWARLFSSQPESTAIIGTGSQDWETELTSDDCAFIHQEAGDVLIDLGYVSSDSWVSERTQWNAS